MTDTAARCTGDDSCKVSEHWPDPASSGPHRGTATAADSMCEACGCTDAAHGDEYGDNHTCPHDCTGWFYV